MPFCCSAWAVTAVMAIGTFWMFWVVFWAVTTTSSTVALEAAWPWASARAGARTPEISIEDATSLDLSTLIISPRVSAGPARGRCPCDSGEYQSRPGFRSAAGEADSMTGEICAHGYQPSIAAAFGAPGAWGAARRPSR